MIIDEICRCTHPSRSCRAGVPEMPEIDGLTKPVKEGDHVTLTCITSGSKPAAEIRWFRNEKEIKGGALNQVELDQTGSTLSNRPTHVVS